MGQPYPHQNQKKKHEEIGKIYEKIFLDMLRNKSTGTFVYLLEKTD